MLYVNVIKLHADIKKLHINIIMLLVDIVYLACSDKKCATIEYMI